MGETEEGRAALGGVDAATFACFVRFVYTRGYKVPEGVVIKVEEEDDTTVAGRVDDSGGRR